MKQPALGIVATVVVMAIALGFISLFSFPLFSGWVAYYLMCIIPMEIVVGVAWGCKQPAFAGGRSQPVKGALLILLTAAVGVVITLGYWVVAGAQVSPPAPMLVMCTIVSVVVMFWAAIMWGGWPFTALIKNPVAAGFTMLVASYVVNYVLFRVFFNYEFMQGAPVYVASLDPHGMFNAWNALVFYLTALTGMFFLINFELWPFTKSPAIMKQPMLGLVWTIFCLIFGLVVFNIGVTVLGMDPVAFMVRVPVPFVFGTIVVMNMLQNSLFAKMAQPLKGVMNVIAAAVIGTALALMYGALSPVVTGKVNPGPPAYDFEIWLASALLAVTFPFLIFFADFLQFWPLRRES